MTGVTRPLPSSNYKPLLFGTSQQLTSLHAFTVDVIPPTEPVSFNTHDSSPRALFIFLHALSISSSATLQSRPFGSNTTADVVLNENTLHYAATEPAESEPVEKPELSSSAKSTEPDATQTQLETDATQSAEDQLKAKVNSMWKNAAKDDDDQIERIACWDYILADDELAGLIGTSDIEKGREILQAMKYAKALDQIESDGRVSEAEFHRLYNPDVLAQAAAAQNLLAAVKIEV